MHKNTKYFLRLVNFNQFACMGIYFKFFGIYLKDKGLSDESVGLVYMVAPLTHIIVTFFFGYISNKFQLEQIVLKALIFFSFVFSLLYLFVDKLFLDVFFGFTVVSILFSFARTPILAMLDSTSFAFIRTNGGDYSSIRIWGSIGFVFSVVLLGLLKEHFFYIEDLTLYLMSLFLLLSFLSSIPIKSSSIKNTKIKMKEVGRVFMENRLLFPFFIIMFLHIISTASYHIFFGLYITDPIKGLGYTSSYLGYFTIVSIFSEIIFFYYYNRFEKLASPFRLVSVIFFLTAIRWFILYKTDNVIFIFMGQLLHSLTWGGFFIISVRYVEHFFKERLRTSGISLFYIFVFGFGNAIGFFLSGAISNSFAHYSQLFLYCALLSLLTFIISLFLSRFERASFRL